MSSWQHNVLQLLRDPTVEVLPNYVTEQWLIRDPSTPTEYVISVRLHRIGRTNELHLEPTPIKAQTWLPTTLTELCAAYLGEHEAFRLWQSEICVSRFPRSSWKVCKDFIPT
jgi:hypothetical protein